jgi:hypothetical protein
MTKTTPEQNKALVLQAFDTLFNKRDYEAADRFWSDTYIQHSAYIEPGRDGLFNLIAARPTHSVTSISSLSPRETTSSSTDAFQEPAAQYLGSPRISSGSRMAA